MKRYETAMIILVTFCLLVVGSQAFLGQAPKHDMQKVTDLNDLNTAVNNYVNQNGYLPEKLADTNVSSALRGRLGQYGYHIVQKLQFQLCATFQTNTEKQYTGPAYSFYPNAHAKGYQCFYSPPLPAPTPYPQTGGPQELK